MRKKRRKNLRRWRGGFFLSSSLDNSKYGEEDPFPSRTKRRILPKTWDSDSTDPWIRIVPIYMYTRYICMSPLPKSLEFSGESFGATTSREERRKLSANYQRRWLLGGRSDARLLATNLRLDGPSLSPWRTTLSYREIPSVLSATLDRQKGARTKPQTKI